MVVRFQGSCIHRNPTGRPLSDVAYGQSIGKGALEVSQADPEQQFGHCDGRRRQKRASFQLRVAS